MSHLIEFVSEDEENRIYNVVRKKKIFIMCTKSFITKTQNLFHAFARNSIMKVSLVNTF